VVPFNPPPSRPLLRCTLHSHAHTPSSSRPPHRAPIPTSAALPRTTPSQAFAAHPTAMLFLCGAADLHARRHVNRPPSPPPCQLATASRAPTPPFALAPGWPRGLRRLLGPPVALVGARWRSRARWPTPLPQCALPVRTGAARVRRGLRRAPPCRGRIHRPHEAEAECPAKWRLVRPHIPRPGRGDATNTGILRRDRLRVQRATRAGRSIHFHISGYTTILYTATFNIITTTAPPL